MFAKISNLLRKVANRKTNRHVQALGTTNLLGGANKKDEQKNPENSRKKSMKISSPCGKESTIKKISRTVSRLK